MLGIALVLSYVESLIPFFAGVPGIKLGLPNLAVVVLMHLYGPREAGLVNVLRIVIAGFLFGSLFGICFSFSGAALSFLVMALCRKSGRVSIFAQSMLGGVSHNIGQLLAAVFVVRTSGILYYLPVLLLAGMVTGALIGVTSGLCLPALHTMIHKESI